MTPAEMNVLKSLVAVAWADGKMEDGEAGVIDGLLSGFDPRGMSASVLRELA